MVETIEKFALRVDLGIIMVPDGYVHESQLAASRRKNRKKFYYYDREVADKNFSNPTRVMKPGDKFRVRIFEQVIEEVTTTKERMHFLADKKAVYTGAQGMSLVLDQKVDQVPKDIWHVSYDEPDHLWKDPRKAPRVPMMLHREDGHISVSLGHFGFFGNRHMALFCFTEVE